MSSKEQEREGFSISAQLKLLREYAKVNDIAVLEEHVDVETAKQSGRSNFGVMIRYLRKHPTVRILLVEKTDRLYTAAEKRDYIRHHRPRGLFVAEGCRLMEIARSTYYDRPQKQADDTAIVEAISTICDEFEFYGYRRVGAARRGIAS